jgi:hypothetical protein
LSEQAIIAADRVDIHMNQVKLAAALQVRAQNERDLDPVVLSIEAKLRRAGKGKRLTIENGGPGGSQPRARRTSGSLKPRISLVLRCPVDFARVNRLLGSSWGRHLAG